MKKVILNFTFFFLIIYSYYIAKPIRSSLFLEWMGPQQLPFVYLFSALVTLAGAMLIDWLLKKLAPVILVPSVLAVFATVLVAFRVLFGTLAHLGLVLSFCLYLFISLFAVVAVTLFWSTCNDTHTPEESRRNYNLIGLGGIVGGLAGGETTRALVGRFGTENLLLLSAGILLLALPLPYLIISLWHREHGTRPAPLQSSAGRDGQEAGVWKILRNPYILSIAGLVFISTIVGSLLDFQYQGIIKNADLAKNVRTAYFGRVFTLINIVGIAVHLIATRPVLGKLGPLGGLLPLPIIAIAGALLINALPSLRCVGISWVAYGGVAYSLNQVTRETLYTPVPRAVMYRAKFYIDTFVFRFGDAFVSLVILLSTMVLKVSKGVYLAYDFFFAAVWAAVVLVFFFRFLRGGYSFGIAQQPKEQ